MSCHIESAPYILIHPYFMNFSPLPENCHLPCPWPLSDVRQLRVYGTSYQYLFVLQVSVFCMVWPLSTRMAYIAVYQSCVGQYGERYLIILHLGIFWYFIGIFRYLPINHKKKLGLSWKSRRLVTIDITSGYHKKRGMFGQN